MRARATAGPAPVRQHLPLRPSDAAPAPLPRTIGPTGVLALQRMAGNQAVGSLLRPAARRQLVVQREGDAPSVAGPLRVGIRLPPVWLTDPEGFLADRPMLRPPGGLRPLPASDVAGLIDWGTLGTAYQDRRLVLQDRDRSLIVGHWQRWYPVAQGLYKLPLAKSLFASPADIMNTLSAKAIDASLAGERPTMVEMFDRQAQQFGVQTTTASVTVAHF